MAPIRKPPAIIVGAKPRPDLIPARSLLAVGAVLAWAEGFGKGAERWRTTTPEVQIASAYRHLLARMAGEVCDPESGLPHLAHVGARVLYALALEIGA